MARASKDLAKRLRFDRFPRPDFFRRWYWLVGVIFVIVGAVSWYGLHTGTKQRQYLPGPVSQVHASFGDRCETCHESYAGVPTKSCMGCHADRVHSTIEATTPDCASCHVEHRATGVFLAVANASCVDCHGDLKAKQEPVVQHAIRTFADHPELSPLRPGKRDEAAVRFDHKLHLSTTKIVPEDTLGCTSCHVPAKDGELMQPIVFEQHCQKCHAQSGLGPDSSVEVVHETPDVVREDLKAKLLFAAVNNPQGIFGSRDVDLPGRVRRPPLDESVSLAAFIDPTNAQSALAKAEAKLYQPLDASMGGGASSLLDGNKYCFLCHDEDGTRAAGDLPTGAIGALPRIKPTKIPTRWLVRGEFSHRTHDLLTCDHCHPDVRESAETAQVNLPPKDVCQRCHIDGDPQSAGTSCMLCHLYHDTSKDHVVRDSRRKEITIEAIFGKEAPAARPGTK
jgi:hypothetical protein